MPAEVSILLIEDDPDDIMFLKEAFTDNGLKVKMEILTKGDQINKYLGENHPLPGLIIMDLNLPKLHGREILCLIRENPGYNEVPIAILTTSSLEEDIRYCMDHGADRYFSKPASPDEYSVVVRELYHMATNG